MPDTPDEVIGSRGWAQGKSVVGSCSLFSVCKPKQRTRTRPSFSGSCLSSTTPTNQTNPSLPINSVYAIKNSLKCPYLIPWCYCFFYYLFYLRRHPRCVALN